MNASTSLTQIDLCQRRSDRARRGWDARRAKARASEALGVTAPPCPKTAPVVHSIADVLARLQAAGVRGR